MRCPRRMLSPLLLIRVPEMTRRTGVPAAARTGVARSGWNRRRLAAVAMLVRAFGTGDGDVAFRKRVEVTS